MMKWLGEEYFVGCFGCSFCSKSNQSHFTMNLVGIIRNAFISIGCLGEWNYQSEKTSNRSKNELDLLEEML